MICFLIIMCLQVLQCRDFLISQGLISKVTVSILPPWPSVFPPFFIFAQSTSSFGVTVFHSLLGDEELQEREGCPVCCCIPGLGEGPAFSSCCTVFVRIMAGVFNFSGVDK